MVKSHQKWSALQFILLLMIWYRMCAAEGVCVLVVFVFLGHENVWVNVWVARDDVWIAWFVEFIGCTQSPTCMHNT